MFLEPPTRFPTWALILMIGASIVGVWLLGWDLWRRL